MAKNNFVKVTVIITVFLGSALLVIFGNNCAARHTLKTDSADTSDQSLTTISAVVTNKLSYEDFKDCGGLPIMPNQIASCLVSRNLISADLKSIVDGMIGVCTVDGQSTNSQFLSMCLAKQNLIIDGHREPYQADIDSCIMAVGLTKTAACLDKKGILPHRLIQSDIDGCAAELGSHSVEACLRKKGLLDLKTTLVQYDATMCEKVTGTQKSIQNCLVNNGLIPLDGGGTPVVVQSDIDVCVTAAGVGGAVKCLRQSGKLPKVVSDAHMKRCIKLVGIGKVASCLDANGLSPVDSKGIATITQPLIESCVQDFGENDIMPCLRNLDVKLPKVLTYADYKECLMQAGSGNVSQCLNENGILPANVTQTTINNCTTAIASNPTMNEVKCLRKQGFLSPALIQADVNACLSQGTGDKLASCLNANIANIETPLVQANLDLCLNAPGVGEQNLAACLQKNGYIPGALMQPHIDACLANIKSGSIADNIYNCILTNGFYDKAAAVPTDQEPLTAVYIDKCMVAEGVGNLASCLRTSNSKKKRAIANTVTQKELASCTTLTGGGAVVGTVAGNIYNCLGDNGLSLTNNVGATSYSLVSEDIGTCYGNVGTAGLYTCLVSNSALPVSTVNASDINSVNYFAPAIR